MCSPVQQQRHEENRDLTTSLARAIYQRERRRSGREDDRADGETFHSPRGDVSYLHPVNAYVYTRVRDDREAPKRDGAHVGRFSYYFGESSVIQMI